MMGSAAVVTALEFLLLYCAPHKHRKWIVIIFACVHSCIILLDYFVMMNFGMVCNQDVIDILVETNERECSEFITTYLQWNVLCGWLCAIFILNYLLYRASSFLVGLYQLKNIFIVIFVLGCGSISRSIYGFVNYHDGYSVPQYIAPTRILYSIAILESRIHDINNLCDISSSLYAEKAIDSPNVVVIIGESFSKFHCSLYDYQKRTYPLLEKWKESGNLVLMEDVICIADATHNNLKAIFSMEDGTRDFGEVPLFPMYFKAAGYNTTLYDNQYILGSGVSFLTNGKLSSCMFDSRNSHGYRFDGNMIEDAKKSMSTYLSVYHLWGQHYTYSNRYTEEFCQFTLDDYPNKYSESQREIMAHYDNACLYNDYVVNSIIKKHSDDDCVVIYFSDHGEEVFELRNFMGHGTAVSSPDIRYQLNVPFMVWMSDSFIEKHKDKAKQLINASSKPINTAEISHFLLDLANVKADLLDRTKSFIDDSYDLSRHRIVLSSVDYDSIVTSNTNNP